MVYTGRRAEQHIVRRPSLSKHGVINIQRKSPTRTNHSRVEAMPPEYKKKNNACRLLGRNPLRATQGVIKYALLSMLQQQKNRAVVRELSKSWTCKTSWQRKKQSPFVPSQRAYKHLQTPTNKHTSVPTVVTAGKVPEDSRPVRRLAKWQKGRRRASAQGPRGHAIECSGT